MADDSWRTNAFRQSVVTKIDEAIRQSGMNTSRNSIEMENHVFQKAKNKEEYLGFVARLILHVREMKPKQGGGMAGPGQGQVGPGMPDPINALQNLASQGSRNPMINMAPQPGQMGGPQQSTATNLLQTLNRGPAQQMMLGNMSGNMAGNMPMQDRQNIGMPPNGGQMTSNQINNQMANQIRMQQIQNSALNQMPNQMQAHLSNQMQNPVQNQIGNQMPGQIQGQLQMQGNLGGAMANQIQNQMIGQQSRNPMDGGSMADDRSYKETVTQFIQYIENYISENILKMNKLKVFLETLSDPIKKQPLHLLNKSEIKLEHFGIIPTSDVDTDDEDENDYVRVIHYGEGHNPMVSDTTTEDQIYREKVKRLRKYIGPVTQKLEEMKNEEIERKSEMKKLLEILSNPQSRMLHLDLFKICRSALKNIPKFVTNDEDEESNSDLNIGSVTISSPPSHSIYRLPGDAEMHPVSSEIDVLSSFGRTIAVELAKIKDPKVLRAAKRQIYNLVLDAQDSEN